MASIYELTSDFLQVQEMIQEGEYDEETLLNTLECLDYEIEIKADNYARIIRNLESDAAGIANEEKRLAGKRKSIDKSIDKLKENLYNTMKVTNKEKFKTELFSFSIGKNPPSVSLIEGKEVPKKYLIPQEPKVDKASIRDDLRDGKKLVFAELTQSESLRIR